MLMAQQKKPKSSTGEKDERGSTLRLNPALMKPVREAVKRLAKTSLSEFVNEAVREKLERMELWPQPEE